MHAPDAARLRAGDYVLVRGIAGAPADGPGRRAQVISVTATRLEVRFTMKDRPLHLDLAGPGEVTPVGTPFPPAPVLHPSPSSAPTPRSRPVGRVVVAAAVLGAVLIALWSWSGAVSAGRAATAGGTNLAAAATEAAAPGGSGRTGPEGTSTATGGTAAPTPLAGGSTTGTGVGSVPSPTCSDHQPQTAASASPSGASSATSSGAISCTAHQTPRAEPQSSRSSSR